MYTFEEIKKRIELITFQDDQFDLIVAVANGGIIPAAMLAQRLEVSIQMIKLSFRDASQQSIYESPQLMEPIAFDVSGKNILLVEDRVKSGATLSLAKQLLMEKGAAQVKTFAVNGKADYPLLDVACFRFPWIVTKDL